MCMSPPHQDMPVPQHWMLELWWLECYKFTTQLKSLYYSMSFRCYSLVFSHSSKFVKYTDYTVDSNLKLVQTGIYLPECRFLGHTDQLKLFTKFIIIHSLQIFVPHTVTQRVISSVLNKYLGSFPTHPYSHCAKTVLRYQHSQNCN